MKRKLTLFITLCLCTVLILSVAFTAQADNASDADSSSASGDTSETSETSEASSVSGSTESESTSESSVSSSSSEEVQTDPETDETEGEPEETTETDEVSDGSESEEVQETQDEPAEEPQQQDPWEVMEGMKAELMNKMSVDYVGLYVRPSMTDEWSKNLLSEGQTWNAGSKVRFVVPDGYNESAIGLFDVKVAAADGTETEIIFVPLIDKVYGELYADEGATLISISDERLVAEEQHVTSEEIAQDNETSKEALKDALVEEVNNNG